MNERKNMLTVVDGETLMDMKLPPTKYAKDAMATVRVAEEVFK